MQWGDGYNDGQSMGLILTPVFLCWLTGQNILLSEHLYQGLTNGARKLFQGQKLPHLTKTFGVACYRLTSQQGGGGQYCYTIYTVVACPHVLTMEFYSPLAGLCSWPRHHVTRQ